MKKTLLLFGILDLIAVGRFIKSLIYTPINGDSFGWINISGTFLLITILISGILLILSKKSGLWIYYLQFPLRLSYYAGLSFGFVLLIGKLFPDNKSISFALFVFALILEITRLVITIIIHRKHFANLTIEQVNMTSD